MYFSSPEECNDPFDSKTFYSFDADKEKWSKVIQLITNRFKVPIKEKSLKQYSEYICSKCPLTFDEATKKDLFD